jgi:mRNA-degrading endonuclease RelE of RelBE toxin-antitoxin system
MAIKIDWSEDARTDIRALDRTTAMFIFEGLLRYVQTGHGDVKALQGEFAGRLRLRIGDYRVVFSPIEGGLHIHAVKNRKDAYR